MKRNFWLRIIISVLIIIVGILTIISAVFTYNMTFDHELCVYLFECTPQEFLDYEFEYDELNDLRKTARVNKKGELVLIFSKQRERTLLESEWLNSVREGNSEYHIVVSSDLKMITTYAPDAKDSEYFYEQLRVLNTIVYKIHFINYLNNNLTESITIVEKTLEDQEEYNRFDLPYGASVEFYIE